MTSVGRRAAIVFAATLFAAAVLLGDLLGSFADSDQALFDHFESGSRRAMDIAGSLLLAVAAIGFGVFARVLAHDLEGARPDGELHHVVAASGMLAAGAMALAAIALVTVPGSIAFGELFDDPGLTEGRAALPQLGVAALAIGTALPGAALVLATSLGPALPLWLRRTGYVVALLLVLASVAGPGMFSLPVWVLLVAFMSRRGATPPPGASEETVSG